MIIVFHSNFKKNFKKRIISDKSLTNKYRDRLILFIDNQSNPVLKDHKLTGSKKRFKSFSITGDIRVIYEQVSEDRVIFYDIGSHNQVY